jgi:tripartite-type tricarboxylate transporter receptor subunit TctC
MNDHSLERAGHRVSRLEDLRLITGAGTWYGLLAPAGTPAPIVARLAGELATIVRSPDMTALIARQGAVPVGDTPEHFAAYLRLDIAKWATVVKESGARVD